MSEQNTLVINEVVNTLEISGGGSSVSIEQEEEASLEISSTGAQGPGILTGGTDGQILEKDGGDDYAMRWGEPLGTAARSAASDFASAGDLTILSDNLSSHALDYSNPHNVSKAQVGLGNVPNLDFSDPSNITQDSSYRFVSDAEKESWNTKVVYTGATADIDLGSYGISAAKATISSHLKLNFTNRQFQLSEGAGGHIAYHNLSAGVTRHRLHSLLGDETTGVEYQVFGKGTFDDISNSHNGIFGYEPTSNIYSLRTNGNGTEPTKALALYTEGNSNQLVLNTNGTTDIAEANIENSGGYPTFSGTVYADYDGGVFTMEFEGGLLVDVTYT